MLWTTDSVAAWSLALDWAELTETPCNEINMNYSASLDFIIECDSSHCIPHDNDDGEDHLLTCLLSSLTAEITTLELASVSTPSPASRLCLE